jgi:rhodanese-related sulfurtransferase
MNKTDEELPIEISVADVRTLVEQKAPMLLFDCREENEHELVSIADTTLIPMSQLEQRVGELDDKRDEHIVVFCHFGGRSLQVTAWLRQHGFTRVQNMTGGIDQWAVEIDPSLARY